MDRLSGGPFPNCPTFFKPPKNSTLIDIGAHAGSFTLKMAKKMDRVVAIEPNPRTFRFLLQNIKLNKLDNVVAINAAVSDREGTTRLFLRDASHLSSIMFHANEGVQVATETLDGIVKRLDLSQVSFIKLDAEGAESIVLQGAKKTLESNRPNIAMEIHSQSEAEDISRLLRSMGYKTLCFRDLLYASHEISLGT